MLPSPRSRAERQLQEADVLADPAALKLALLSWPEGPLSELSPSLAAFLALEPALAESFTRRFTYDVGAGCHLLGCSFAEPRPTPGSTGPHLLVSHPSELHDCISAPLRAAARSLATHPLSSRPALHVLSATWTVLQDLATCTPGDRLPLERPVSALLTLTHTLRALPEDAATALLHRLAARYRAILNPHLTERLATDSRLTRSLSYRGAPQLVECAVPLDPDDALPLAISLHLLDHPELLSPTSARQLLVLQAPLAWLLPTTSRTPLTPEDRRAFQDPATAEAIRTLTTELRLRGLSLPDALSAARLACEPARP